MSIFDGKPLRYLIGATVSTIQGSDAITELPYDTAKTFPAMVPWKRAPLVAYMNALDEEYSDGVFGPAKRYGPYAADQSGTPADWGEGRMIVGSDSFNKCIDDQCKRAQLWQADAVEIDNLDSYTLSEVMLILARVSGAWNHKIMAKNPCEVEGDHALILEHQAVVGAIVEAGCGTVVQMEALRRVAHKPDLPVWFVHNRAERSDADKRVKDIQSAGFANMSVSWSPSQDDYAGSMFLLLPEVSA